MIKERESLYQLWYELLPTFRQRLKEKRVLAFDFDGTLTPKDNPKLDTAIQMAMAEAAFDYLKGSIPIEVLRGEIAEQYLKGKGATNYLQTELGVPRSIIKKVLGSVPKWQYLQRNPMLEPMLKELDREGLALILASNYPRGENLRSLGVLGLDPESFDHIITMDDITHSKPHPEIFQRVVGLCGCPVEEIVFIGDSPTKDVGGASGIGMDSVLVGEPSREATAWVLQIEDLSRLFFKDKDEVV